MPQEKQKKQSLPYRLRIRCLHRDSDNGASTSPTPSKKSKTQNWRDTKKAANPAKYRESKKQAATYSQYYRLQCAKAHHTLAKRNLSEKECEEAMKWQKRKEKTNESARKRMKKINDRKKAEKAANKDKPHKILTRKQKEACTSKETAKKQRQRDRYTPERKEAVNARRRELYAQKQDTQNALEEKSKKLIEKEERLNEMEALLKAKEAELDDKAEDIENRNNLIPDDDAIDLRSSGARDRAYSRAKKALPKKRSHCVSTSLDLINKASPNKTAAFRLAGIRPKKRLEEVATGLQAPRCSAIRKSLASTLSTIKKSKLQRAACRKFGLSRKLLANAKKQSAGRKPVPLATIKVIEHFYETNSIPLPDKKLVSKKTYKPRHIMDTSIANLHLKYIMAHPDHPVSSSIFYRYRPTHVKPKSGAKYMGCLCEYCENINLKIGALNHLQPKSFKDIYHVTAATMCPKPADSKFHYPSCITRSCNKCGLELLDTIIAPLLANPDRKVEWTRWEMVEKTVYTKKQTKKVKKREPIIKSDKLINLVKELKAEMKPFAEHVFNKDWQHNQQCQLKDKLHADEALGIFDFAENYKCDYQREVQSAYYSHESATVHPIVTYYICNTCLKPVTESCIMVSNDLTHDYNLVNTFQQVVAHHLTSTRELTLSRFFRFSDGCSSQYKSKGPISDISYSREDFGLNIHHNYSGTRHGKGASDGESGVVKKHASDAVKAGTVIIKNAMSLFDYLSQNLTKEAPDGNCCVAFRRTMFYVPFEDVRRNRPGRAIKTVKDTRKMHSVKNVKGGVVSTRNLSCFCDPCLQGFGDCKNKLYVHPWKEHRLHNKKRTAVTTSDYDDNVPVAASHDSSPDAASHDSTPAAASYDSSPAAASHYSIPAAASHDSSPAESSHDSIPAATSHDSIPATASHDCTHAAAGHDSIPAAARHDSTPAAAGHDSILATASHDSSPAAAGHDSIPAAASHDSTPAAAGHDSTSATACNDIVPAPDVVSTPKCDAGNRHNEQPQSKEIKVNTYVAVKFEGVCGKANKAFVYMAMVTIVQENQAQLKFMRRNDKGLYDFTSEREATHPMDDILMQMAEPTMVEESRRSYLYKFNEEDLHMIGTKFLLK